MGNKQVTGRAGRHRADGSGNARADGHGPASQVQSVDRALTILDILARDGELGVTEIAASLGVHKSTAFRLVNALEQHRLVEQPSERGKYRLGFGIVRLASATTARMSLTEESRPFCRQLAAEFNETVNVVVLDTDAAVNIVQEQGQATVSVQNWIGQRTPLHATSSGKVLLAWTARPQLLEFLADALARYTPHTITTGAALRAELDRVRHRAGPARRRAGDRAERGGRADPRAGRNGAGRDQHLGAVVPADRAVVPGGRGPAAVLRGRYQRPARFPRRARMTPAPGRRRPAATSDPAAGGRGPGSKGVFMSSRTATSPAGSGRPA